MGDYYRSIVQKLRIKHSVLMWEEGGDIEGSIILEPAMQSAEKTAMKVQKKRQLKCRSSGNVNTQLFLTT